MLFPMCYRRKSLWRWINTSLIYEYSRLLIGVISLKYSFSRTVVFVFIPRPFLFVFRFSTTWAVSGKLRWSLCSHRVAENPDMNNTLRLWKLRCTVFSSLHGCFQQMRKSRKEKKDGVWLLLLSLVDCITLDQNIYCMLRNTSQYFYCSSLTEQLNYMFK